MDIVRSKGTPLKFPIVPVRKAKRLFQEKTNTTVKVIREKELVFNFDQAPLVYQFIGSHEVSP